jgi:hypothetical protein
MMLVTGRTCLWHARQLHTPYLTTYVCLAIPLLIAAVAACCMLLQVFLEDAGYDWKVLGPDVQDVDYVAWQADQDAYACSGQKCSAQSLMLMHSNWRKVSVSVWFVAICSLLSLAVLLAVLLGSLARDSQAEPCWASLFWGR